MTQVWQFTGLVVGRLIFMEQSLKFDYTLTGGEVSPARWNTVLGP